MIFSCLPVSYFNPIIQGEMTIGQWANEAAALGFDAIDLSILFFKNRNREYLKKIREDIETAGMRVAILNTYPEFTHPDPQERKRQLAQLTDDIMTAALVGAEMVRVTSGPAYPKTSRAEGIEWVVEGLKSIAEASERSGVKLVYENHSKPGIWDYPDFNLPGDIFLEIAEGIKNTSLGLLFDTANPLVHGDDPLSLLEPIIDRVVWVHAADTGVRGALKPVVIGTGIVPFHQIFARLHQASFAGGISLEEASGQGPSAMEKALVFIRNAWQQADV